MIAVGRKAFI